MHMKILALLFTVAAVTVHAQPGSTPSSYPLGPATKIVTPSMNLTGACWSAAVGQSVYVSTSRYFIACKFPKNKPVVFYHFALGAQYIHGSGATSTLLGDNTSAATNSITAYWVFTNSNDFTIVSLDNPDTGTFMFLE